ncbi:hypothetical protein HID58_094883 [Brassica napus]|uniref:MATH domain-containing protein n=1 Tax=Brassica napus TaxID=3708 RepID=A0ABQ7X869_BRANA|nr:hypothetical protein HID58_094883 [Brassica napus]
MIPHFSDMEDKFYYLMIFSSETDTGFNRKVGVHFQSIYMLKALGQTQSLQNTWGAVNLRLKNQRSTNHRERYSWYPIRSDNVNSIISLADLHDASKGYLVNDAIIFEAEMVKVTVTNIVSV